MPKPIPKHQHAFGDGYYSIEHGVRTTHTQVCSVCRYRKDSPVNAEIKPSGPSVQGLSSGERFTR